MARSKCREQADADFMHDKLQRKSSKCYVFAPDKCEPENIFTLRKSFPTHNIKNRLLQVPEAPLPRVSLWRQYGCLEGEFLIGFKIYININCFSADGSVMRTCALIVFDDFRRPKCGINYCYRRKEGCYMPERGEEAAESRAASGGGA